MMRKPVAPYAMLLLFATPAARADEGGTSFWLPGQMGSLSAAPGEVGWSLPLVGYHTESDAGDSKEFEIGGKITVGLQADADLLILAPTYVFRTPVAGAQASVGVSAVVGGVNVDIDATLTGPHGRSLSGSTSDGIEDIGDLFPTASLKWNRGVHNFMLYSMGGVPVGAYDKDRLANLGTNHWSIDGGVGYTFLDAAAGHEFSAVLGVTHNFENNATDYHNGEDGHIDWAASQFLSEHWHVGLVGYFYQQLDGDSGSGATLGDFESRVNGIGPQVGYFTTICGQTWYANLKGIHEFDAKNRPEGWNLWLTVAIPLGP